MTATAYKVLLDTVPPGHPRTNGDRTPEPWESSMQATCECLSWRGALDNLERRHAEDELGETVYRDVPVQGRSAVVTAHHLIESGVFTADELSARMTRIRERLGYA